MTLREAVILTILLASLQACTILEQDSGTVPGYTLSSPDERIILPPVLFEISGITLSGPSSMMCIQDEDGIVFEYDPARKEITGKINFWGPGDYEGIASVGDTLYVLRSDGFLFEITAGRSAQAEVTPYPTGIPPSDNEGLCYDPDNHRLLITCKQYYGKDSKSGNRRNIFAFDLRKKELSASPVYRFRMKDIFEAALNQNPALRAEYGRKGSRNNDIIRFNPSAIAIHPVNGKLYILSAVDHAIAIFSKEGMIENFVLLNHDLFNQPEGILFLKNGDMFISNEGGNSRPTLLRFNYRAK